MRIMNLIYDHHMLVVRVVDNTHLVVIHYSESTGTDGIPQAVQAIGFSSTASGTAVSSGNCAIAEVVETEVIVDPKSNEIELLQYPKSVAIYTGQKAVSRAREKNAERKYNLFFNNCESFVNWCITDKRVSNQGETALKRLVAVAGVVVGTGIGVGAIVGVKLALGVGTPVLLGVGVGIVVVGAAGMIGLVLLERKTKDAIKTA